MTEQLATYNRDLNATSEAHPHSFVPEYGSSVKFNYGNVYQTAGDNLPIKLAFGVNHTILDINLKFSNKNEEEANSFLHLLEEVGQKTSGNLDFNTPTVSGVEIAFPTGNIYKNLKDFLVPDYSFNFHNNLFDIDLNLRKNSHSYIFDWSGSSYLKDDRITTNSPIRRLWKDGESYEKFDIVFFPKEPGVTGTSVANLADVTTTFDAHAKQKTNPFAAGQMNKLEKFYYCISGHDSNHIQSPTGISGANVWTREFFFDLDDGMSISSDRSNLIQDSKGSFLINNKLQHNEGLIKGLTFNLNNRSNKETYAIIHFIEKHENGRPFELNFPQLYKKRKFFITKSMKHTFVYKDCNDIQLEVNEILRYKRDTFSDSFRPYFKNA